MSIFAREVLDESMVYPGHGLVFAYLALVKYGSPVTACARPNGQQYPNCVGDPDMPGSGDAAWDGHDILISIIDGTPVQDIVAAADAAWVRRCGPGTNMSASSATPTILRAIESRHHKRNFEAGRCQARRIADGFVSLVEKWRAE